ncbi:MAG: tyrosine-protein phosphatase [Brooklawnia sp.]
MTTEPNWVDLDGVVNMRDLGGRTTVDGRTVRSRVVLRSDNLADLTPTSAAYLLNHYRLSDVVDLRTNGEHARDGVWPFNGEVRLHKMSLYPDDDPAAALPPWFGQLVDGLPDGRRDHAAMTANHYLGYFVDRPDSLIGALRTIAGAPGAAIINCAAGKDRTGTTSALLLSAVGVPADQVIADYAASNQRVPAILQRLGEAATIGSPEHAELVAAQSTPPEIMEILLDRVDQELGGVESWLDRNGWDADDQSALESRLLERA